MRYDDDELLAIVRTERQNSIGWGEGDNGELRDRREQALEYYKGDVNDVPAMANRSKAVSTDVAETVDTALPDLLEIFIGGDDVATFQPMGAEDEESAKQESEYVKHVIFNENPGVLLFHTTIKDALLCATGIFHWFWDREEIDEPIADVPTDQAEAIISVAKMQGEDIEGEDDGQGVTKLTRRRLKGMVKVISIPPEDFTVAKDTVDLKDTTYCAWRARPRVQDLIADGVDAEKARSLKSYVMPDEHVSQARDEAGEESDSVMSDAKGDMRQVEVRYHYVRLLSEEGDATCLYKITTDSEEAILIDQEEVEGSLPFGAITSYMNSHRFYGESIADKILEIQRIKTALLRMFLDSGYFALNQRNYVDMSQASEFTISDLLRNEPNMPVRGKGPGAVTPLGAGGLSFDALAALEHVSVMGEQRTGIVRNAQGLNPDTLHDTAQGAMALMTKAMKRVHLMARMMAETGIKDLYLGVHELLRAGYSNPDDGAEYVEPTAKLSGQWATVRPQDWKPRKNLDVGVGSAGKEHQMVALMQIGNMQEKIVAAGVPGVVKPDNIFATASRFAQAASLKTPEVFFSDPANEEPAPPKPDPEVVKAQMQMQLEGEKSKAQLQLKAQEGQMNAQMQQGKAQQDYELAVAKMQSEAELRRYQIEQELMLKRETTAAELEMKRELLIAELQMKREQGIINAQVAHETGMAKAQASTSVSDVHTGGDPG